MRNDASTGQSVSPWAWAVAVMKSWVAVTGFGTGPVLVILTGAVAGIGYVRHWSSNVLTALAVAAAAWCILALPMACYYTWRAERTGWNTTQDAHVKTIRSIERANHHD